jgi:hypothetical protein
VADVVLADFLADSARTPFAFGRRDCGLWMADWIRLRRGVDPAAHLRGRYRTELGCARLLKRGGGLLEVVRTCFEGAGLVETASPKPGDVGVVRVMTAKGEGVAGAICTGRRWAILGGGGVMSQRLEPLAAWEV